ncbi:MAG: hypothetical protein WAO98_03265 [Alphaproteobacteria bacterium]
MASPTLKETVDTTRIGEYAANQPVSGVVSVNQTFVVNGHGRGAFVRMEVQPKEKKSA